MPRTGRPAARRGAARPGNRADRDEPARRLAGALKRIGAARRKAQPPRPRANDAATTEYLYVPCARTRHNGHSIETRRWVQEVPIVKKTAELQATAGTGVTPLSALAVSAANSSRPTPGAIRKIGVITDTPAGVIPIPGDRHRSGPAGRFFFATREAAEGDLYRGERERAGQAGRGAQLIKELRRAMADAHPDHGGTAEQFIQVHRRYQTALRQATLAEASR